MMRQDHYQRNCCCHIAVIDEDPAVRHSLKFYLELDGFSVQTWSCGDALLNSSASSGCDCLIVDQDLPGTKGIELVAKLRNHNPSISVILVAMNPCQMLQAEAAAAGVAIVEKPLTDGALLDCIRRTMSPVGQ